MTKFEINEKLKELATTIDEFTALESPTEEQVAAVEAAETEIDRLTIEKAELEAEEKKALLREKAQSARESSRASTRLTASPKFGRQHESVLDDPKRGFKTLGQFACRIAENHANIRGDEMLMRAAAGAGMTQGVLQDGGVLVPPAFSKAIWDGVLRRSNSLLQYCFSVPVDPGNESITIPAIAESSRANGSRQGGVQGYWKEEQSQMTETKPSFRQVKLTPHELYVFMYVSDKLLRNSPGTVSSLLEQAGADEIAFKIGDAIINGTGVGQPRGVVGHPGTAVVPKETGQAANTVVLENIVNMEGRMHVNYEQGAVWFVNQEVRTALQTLAFPVGTGGVPGYLPPGGLSDSPYALLRGKPVIPIEYCSALGTSGDIIYANLSAYAAAIRGVVDSQYSIHLKFDYAQTAFRMIFEMDGQPFLNSTITPFKGSKPISPIVTLATRG